MAPKYPKKLKEQSTIALVCPAGGFQNYKPIDKTIKYLIQIGCKVKVGKHLLNGPYKYLSASDKCRAFDLNKFINDKTVDAIYCMRGGYGCTRILDLVDYSGFKKAKKIIVGYSDVTALLLALYKRTGLITIHGPMFGNRLLDNKLKPSFKANINNLFALLSSDKFKFSYTAKSICIRKGVAKGTLLGGNLTTLCSLIGSEYLPSFNNSILFLEDCNEDPYVIDRLFRQLINSRILSQVSGIVLGTFEGCKFKNKIEFYTLIKDVTNGLDIPIMSNFPFGHGKRNYALPLGNVVMMNSGLGTLYSV